MAYGIKRITGTYVADSRSDWMIFGDFEYRNGRKTPDISTPGMRPVPPPRKPKKCAEVDASNLKRIGANTSQIERWAKRHAERGDGHGGQDAPDREEKARRKAEVYERAMASSTSAPALLRPTTMGELGAKTTNSIGLAARSAVQAAHDTAQAKKAMTSVTRKPPKMHLQSTSWNHGQIPGWLPKKYELPLAEENAAIGLPRSACEYDGIAGSGDHTRGMHANVPHFLADSHRLGQVEVPGQDVRHEMQKAADSRRAGIYAIDTAVRDAAFRDQTGDYANGIRGRLPHHKSTISDLGYEQNFVLPEYHNPDKYHTGFRRYKDKPDPNAKKDQEGDECRGIKTGQPHFRTTLNDLGSIPNWPKSRYSMEAIAGRDYRLTLWRD
eukprot:TRINITY_DN31498_c0_g1_i1.p1 TRINITY_DN31498_c0_g1~~TRINITY_DN31498_c0_g1_i1.p1  ORF type:complete len:399 (-),score=56.42 TRINITY_DN31498_c0_g1_i1:226-1371(-)